MFSGLNFFKQMHSNGTPISSYVIASFHNPKSITWRWTICYSRRKAGRTGFYFRRVYKDRGFNFHCGLNLPVLGSISIQTQPHMWEKKRPT